MLDRSALIEAVMQEYEGLNARMAGFSGPTFLGLDITMPQAKVLHQVRAKGSMPMSELVAHLGVTVPTVTGIIDRLVERDLVVRRGTPDDRRRVIIEITPAGVEMIDAMRDINAKQLRGLVAIINRDEIEIVLQFFQVLGSALTRFTELDAEGIAALARDVEAREETREAVR
jgi:DNA-binding MarR family transcriptional regulator